jgi:hypothetical protein
MKLLNFSQGEDHFKKKFNSNRAHRSADNQLLKIGNDLHSILKRMFC